jgi:hypothetical protein
MRIVEQTACTRSLINTTKSSRRHTLRFCFGSYVLSRMASVEGSDTCDFRC